MASKPGKSEGRNKSFAGINTTVTLKLTFIGDASSVAYRKNGGSYTTFSSGTTITVVNGNTLNFRVYGVDAAGSISVLNNSNSDSLIDTFDYA